MPDKEPTAEQLALALARKIAADRPGLNALQKQAILDGEWDDIDGVRCALDAIIETTELAAKLALRQQAVFGSSEYAVNQPSSSFGERFACGRIAESLRVFDHLKGSSDV